MNHRFGGCIPGNPPIRSPATFTLYKVFYAIVTHDIWFFAVAIHNRLVYILQLLHLGRHDILYEKRVQAG